MAAEEEVAGTAAATTTSEVEVEDLVEAVEVEVIAGSLTHSLRINPRQTEMHMELEFQPGESSNRPARPIQQNGIVNS